MGRRAKLSHSPLAQVRRYFGLSQATLAAWLGIQPAQVGHLEAGRRASTGEVLRRLVPLAVAASAGPVPAEADPPEAAPAPAALLARLDYCQHHAARLRRALVTEVAPRAQARRWQQALPALLAAPPDPAELPARAARARAWLLRRQAEAEAALDAEAAARYHLLRAQAEGLEAEATALVRLLP